MKKKILKVIMLTVLVLTVLTCVLLFVQMHMMQDRLAESGLRVGDEIETTSESAMREQAQSYMLEAAVVRAQVFDTRLSNFRQAVEIIAGAAADIYADPDSYTGGHFDTYTADDMGKPVTYAAYGDGVEPDVPEIVDETAALADLKGVLASVRDSNDSMSVDYFASETGIFVCSEEASEYNIPDGDNPLYFEARLRPWYTEAKESGHTVFTGMIRDADTGEYAVSCGAPVYCDGRLVGVAGAGVMLDDIRDNVDNYRIGENGYACVINDHGQVLFSGSHTGVLSPTLYYDTDLRESSESEVADLVTDALEGHDGVRLITLDGITQYVSYAPMETVGWSFFLVLPEEEVLASTQTLIEELDTNISSQNEYVHRSVLSSVNGAIIILIAIGAVACLMSSRFADRLARPVVELTEKVRGIEGDNLDFEWDQDTGDEIQILAESFGSMTGRMKDYIEDITTITADKERLNTELGMATRIQASMIPHIFPPFPERSEFDIYAGMDPAREVGGDFYDYFLIDDDHLCLLIADVSGKGVPAALFMMVSKIILQSCAMLGRNTAEILEKTNEALCSNNQTEMFVTVWLGILEISTGKLTAANAGHEYPAIRRKGGEFELFKDIHGFVLGGMDGMHYVEYDIFLKPGDSLFLYTDGVPEASSADNEMFGTARMLEVLNRTPDAAPKDLLDSVRAEVDAFAGGAEQFDDLTMLCFEYHGADHV